VADAAGEPRRPTPGATYRLQLHAEFGFAEAADLAGYLASLGVTHAYLSPILQAAPGSRHGYDVVDHSRISADLGGEDGFRYLVKRLASHGLGVVVDVVPNHMAIPVPEYLNRALWSVLADGQRSSYAHWFDIDWAALAGRMLLPILASPPRSCLDDFKISRLAELPGAIDADIADVPVLLYAGHVLPLRSGTERMPMPDLVAAQHYQLESWRTAAASLNWRRFFDISSLIALRVEEPDVFAATHGLLLGLIAEGLIDGLRVDHPDGLADPRGYLRQLATAAGGRWVVAEKILAAGEELPSDWPCAGTTGYDSLAAIGAMLTDPVGADRLREQYTQFAGAPADFATVARAAKREIAGQSLAAEVGRLVRLLERLEEPGLSTLSSADLRAIMTELLGAFDGYRAYVVPGERPPDRSAAGLAAAAAAARRRLPRHLARGADAVTALLLGRGIAAGRRAIRDELIVLFQQTCAAVQAKGVEDTATYRWTCLLSANEVGSDPDLAAASADDFHALALRLSEAWPATMTTLSTHDTKRQEDVRMRLAALAEAPALFGREMERWHDRVVDLSAASLGTGALGRATVPDPPTEYLMWQTLVGAWPIDGERLGAYLRKAMREAKLTTSWVDPDPRYEAAAIGFAQLALADAEISRRIADLVASINAAARANSLGAKLVQLTMPGVPDVYQGCEVAGLALVDPDNRRPVDFGRRHAMLAALDSDHGARTPGALAVSDDPPAAAAGHDLDAAKLLVTSRALRLRRAHPAWFAGDYRPVRGSGAAAEHVLAFCRSGRAITVATRMPGRLRRAGGWRDTALPLAPGSWRDILSGAEHTVTLADRSPAGGGWLRLDHLLARLPVALLVRTDGPKARGASAE
jgi:(1->4)-alpha-D-glucan 1-alpha-D-glucosylmutase